MERRISNIHGFLRRRNQWRRPRRTYTTRAAEHVSRVLEGSPPDRPWPPGVEEVSSGSPALSPAEALKTFYLPPGYSVELVASEPLVHDPVAIDWDLDGRLWVVELSGYMRN